MQQHRLRGVNPSISEVHPSPWSAHSGEEPYRQSSLVKGVAALLAGPIINSQLKLTVSSNHSKVNCWACL